MYEPFFGMERRPFSATPDPGCFFSSSELQTVIEELTVCVERGQGIGILTAAAGIGKTLLCQHFATRLRQRDESEPQFKCVYLANSNFPTRRSLLQAILFEIGDNHSRRDESELRIDLRSRLLSLRPQHEAFVLIVDEAHIFSDDLLEELRTLSDLADNGSSLVRIVLSGQHELEERLTDRGFDALNQRISKQVYAEPFTISESVDYIQYRLTWSGCDIASVFSDEALGVITRASGGVPRCLNQLCDHSLLLAFASDQKPVAESTVREALEDLKQLPLHWNDVSDATEVVGYVDAEEEQLQEMTEAFDARSTDESIDPEIEAALSQLSSGSSTESTPSDAADNFASDTNDDCEDDFGIVESLSGKPAESSNTTHVPPLAGGFEFDFSSPAENTGEAEQAIGDTSSESLRNSPEFPEIESANIESSTSADASQSESGRADPDAADVTLVEVLPSTPQETMLETRPQPGGNVDESEDGISFMLTADGFELDDFGPPEELDSQVPVSSADVERPEFEETSDKESNVPDSDNDLKTEEAVDNEEQTDSGVIEFSFGDAQASADSEVRNSCETEELPAESATSETVGSASVEQLEPQVPETETGKPTVSAAEKTLALFGQDSVLPAHKCDTILSASDEVLEAGDSKFDEIQNAAETELAADITQPSSADTPTREAAITDETTAEFQNIHDEKPTVINQAINNETGYEEELVYDPYAALQTPDGAGIVWDVVSTPEHANVKDVVESTERDDASANAPEIDSVESGDLCETIESAESGDEHSLDTETPEETVGVTQQIIDPSHDFSEVSLEVETTSEHETDAATAEGSKEVSDQFEKRDAAAEELEDVSAIKLTDSLEQQREVEVEPVVADEDLVANLCEEQTEEVCHHDIDSAEATTDAVRDESNDVNLNEHDIVQPVDERPLQPDRLVDAVLPLLAELDEDLDPVSKPASAGRSVLDIEAELIQTIEHDNDDLEDQIGATMLDICLDTQSALQDSAAAIRNAEAAGLENVNDVEDTTDELPGKSFDIVQPEHHPHPDKEAGYKLDLRFEELDNKKQGTDPSPEQSAGEEIADKPFGRLFSDLRRRNRCDFGSP